MIYALKYPSECKINTVLYGNGYELRAKNPTYDIVCSATVMGNVLMSLVMAQYIITQYALGSDDMFYVYSIARQGDLVFCANLRALISSIRGNDYRIW